MITRQAVSWSVGIAITGFLLAAGQSHFFGIPILREMLKNTVTPWEVLDFSMIYIFLFVAMTFGFYLLSHSRSILCLGPLLLSAAASFFFCGYNLLFYFALVFKEEFTFANQFDLRPDFLPCALIFSIWFVVGTLGLKMTMALPARLALAKNNKRKTREDYRSRSTVFGDARLGKWADIRKRIAPQDNGIVLGENYDPRENPDYDHDDRKTWGKGGKSELIQMKTSYEGGHTLIVAGTGAAKTSAYVIPTCMTYPHALVVVDPNGSVLKLCRTNRSERGRNVREVSPELGLDVMAMIKHCLKESRDYIHLADMMIVREKGSEFSEYYAKESIAVLAALLEHFDKEYKNISVLDELSKIVFLSESQMKQKLFDLAQNTKLSNVGLALGSMVEKDAKFFTYFTTGLKQSLNWLNQPSLLEMVSKDAPSSPSALDQKTDIFITLSMSDFEMFPGLVRLILGSITYDMMKREDRANEKLMIVDEAALLGYFELFEKIRDRARQFKLHLMVVFQSVGQIIEAYGRSGPQSWNDVAVKAYSAIGDLKTAQELSQFIGTFTVDIAENTQGASGGTLATIAQSSNISLSERTQQAALITPDEILQLPADAQILLFRRQPPLICGKALHFRRREWLPDDLAHSWSNPIYAALGKFKIWH